MKMGMSIRSIILFLIVIIICNGCSSHDNKKKITIATTYSQENNTQSAKTSNTELLIPDADEFFTLSISLSGSDIQFLIETIDKYIKIKPKNSEKILSLAVEKANLIQDVPVRDELLSNLAVKYIELQLYDKASRVAELISKGSYREIAIKLAKADQINESIALAMQIPNNHTKCYTLLDIAGVMKNSKEQICNILSSASYTATQIEDNTLKDSVLKTIALLYCDIGDFEKAYLSAEMINDNIVKFMLSSEISAKTGAKENSLLFLKKAQKMVVSIDREDDKYLLLREIASQYVDLGEYNDALNIIDECLKIQNVRLTEKTGYYLYLYTTIIEKLDKSGQKDYSRQVFEKLLKTIRDLYTDNESHNGMYDFQIYMNVVLPLVDKGYLSEALEAVKLNRNLLFKSSAYLYIAEQYMSIASEKSAAECLQESLEIINSIPDPLQKAEKLLIAAEKYYTFGQYDKSIEILNASLDIVRQSGTDNDASISLLRQIALLYYNSGRCDRAIEVADILNPCNKAETMLSIAESSLITFPDEQAKGIISKVADIEKSITEPGARIPVNMNLSRLYIKTGNREKAREQMLSALEQIPLLRDNKEKSRTLVDIDIAYIQSSFNIEDRERELLDKIAGK